MAAQLKMTVGCGGCGIGDCGRARGVCRQRVVAMAEEEEGNPRPSRDDTSAARAKEEMEALVLGRQRAATKLTGEDGGAGARQPEGDSDGRGRSRQCYARLCSVAVTVVAALLVSSMKVVNGCGMTLADGLCEVAARSREEVAMKISYGITVETLRMTAQIPDDKNSRILS
ncbi:hypothetical protein BHM03_00059504 [Ensete ventricosum]|nr:hypothetical protein BHM03_00059504 [Ensete ventricosum]